MGSIYKELGKTYGVNVDSIDISLDEEKEAKEKKSVEEWNKIYGVTKQSQLESLASRIKETRGEYDTSEKAYEDIKEEHSLDMEAIADAEQEEERIQSHWNRLEEGKILPEGEKGGGYRLGRMSTWGNILRAGFNLYPEGHVLHEEGKLYKDITDARKVQNELRSEWFQPPMSEWRGNVAVPSQTKFQEMSSMKTSRDDILMNLARMQAEHKKRTGDFYGDIHPRAKKQALSYLKEFEEYVKEGSK
tara:strand:+ start:1026 stop:1763 length:738 start_codon:yes stop_codon:yes gene_type:complete